MLKRFVRLVTLLTFLHGESSKVDRMLERTDFGTALHRSGRVVENLMTNVAVVADDFAATTDMLAVMTTETTG